MKLMAAILLLLIVAGQGFVSLRQRNEIIKLQMDRDEVKIHTDMLAQIIKVQQYQIDVLSEK